MNIEQINAQFGLIDDGSFARGLLQPTNDRSWAILLSAHIKNHHFDHLRLPSTQIDHNHAAKYASLLMEPLC